MAGGTFVHVANDKGKRTQRPPRSGCEQKRRPVVALWRCEGVHVSEGEKGGGGEELCFVLLIVGS